ncbi:hypothetical protein L1280_002808 [Deinococcus sp. HSC-46F16]|uniref:hypothetical protein n=1 Tax=Deinococcus sp. HSC-46F16 TaxID=2910968 RepID=UPI0020A02B39|nr:hypothetical protein [Deinococcus sp. HSC-46F16]MCP2015640.1 hypothetical protein [Deinococcus sp. HSC-46F16]
MTGSRKTFRVALPHNGPVFWVRAENERIAADQVAHILAGRFHYARPNPKREGEWHVEKHERGENWGTRHRFLMTEVQPKAKAGEGQ